MPATATSNRIQIDTNRSPFLDIGFGFTVNMNRVTSIIPFTGTMTKRLYLDRRDKGMFFDATRGRGKRSLIVLDNGEIWGSAFKPETILTRQF